MAYNNVLLKNIHILQFNKKIEIKGPFDILIEDNIIKSIKNKIKTDKNIIVKDYTNRILMPGFVQGHTHLCQTLFRGIADDLALLDWLKKYIMPLESFHTYETLYWSSILGIAELISNGVTTIIDMATANYTDAVFQAMADTGIRGFSGKMFMDIVLDNNSIQLITKPNDIMKDVEFFVNKWHQTYSGRINYILNPRFAVSCSKEMLKNIKDIADYFGLKIHIHGSENKNEVELVRKKTGFFNVEYLNHLGLLSDNTIFVHSIWVNEDEIKILKDKSVVVAHCPISNLKLSSGIIKLKKLLDNNIKIIIGSDGTPCNNNLDILQEIKIASILQKYQYGPDAIDTSLFVKMITMDAAKFLKLNKLGEIKEGYIADLVVYNPNKINTAPYDSEKILSHLVYSSNSSNIEAVIINGKFVKDNYKLNIGIPQEEIIANANKQYNYLKSKLKLQP